MTSESLSALVAALLSVAIGLSVYLEDRRRPAYHTFAMLCSSLFLYHLANFISLMLEDRGAQLISYMLALAIPLTLLRFVKAFLADDPAETPAWDKTPLAAAMLLLGLLVYLALFPNPPVFGWFKAAVFVFVLYGAGWSAWRMYRRYQETPSQVDRTRLRYLIGGLGITIIGLLIAYIPQGDFPTLPALGILFTTLFLYFLSQNLFLYRLLDLQEVLARVSILALMVVIISAVYALLLAWVDPGQPGMFLFNTLISSVIVLILIDPVRSLIEERVNRYLFREKYELSRHLLALNRDMRHVIDLDELAELVMHNLNLTRRVTGAALYVVSEDGSGFLLRGHLGPRPPERLDAATNANFLEHLRSTGILVLDTLIMEREARRFGWETERTGSDQVLGTVIQSMEELGAGVAVPLATEEQVLGLLAINDDRMREAYATDELELIRDVAGQIAFALQNSRLFKHLQERDRLAILGQMAAGLAHEIRNPLGAIKGAAQYLRPDPEALAEDEEGEGLPAPELPQEVAEFLDIIIQEVDRLNRVVSQFLDYARPDLGAREPLDLNAVVRRSVQMLESEADGVEIRQNLDPDLPATRADDEQLHQVFLNLGLNALQAMPEGGTLRVSTRSMRRGRPRSTYLEVSFKDNGEGIDAEARRSLFIPFFTTKNKGSGLGLPISQRIAENHGGTIRVHSVPGKGATFTLSLPLHTGDTSTNG